MRTASSIVLTCIWIVSLSAVGSGVEAPPGRTNPPIVTAKKELNKTPGSWKAGVAKANITPEKPMWLAGYGGRRLSAAGKFSSGTSQALALGGAPGPRGAPPGTELFGKPPTTLHPLSG